VASFGPAPPLSQPLQTSKPRTKSRQRSASERTPSLSVIIVNYHQWGDTAKLVEQLSQDSGIPAGKTEVLVVDNHSPFHPIARRLRRRPGVSLRRCSRNRGFACAVNEACRLSRGSWFLLLNPDLTVKEGFLDGVQALAERLEQESPRAGVIGFQLRNADGSRQFSSGPFPTLWTSLIRLVLPRSRRKYRPLRVRHRTEVPWVTGCCLLVRRECLEDLRGFDEEFFVYYEDVDLCRRARERGWTVWYEPTLRAIHHRPLHARAVAVPLRVLTRHALLVYGRKHWPGWQFRFLAGLVRFEARIRGFWKSWKRDPLKADQYAVLAAIATDMAGGRSNPARKRLRRFMLAQERDPVPDCRLQLAD
jgi:N-acetylglucosaminyl-diphospho-decaprenol L-rhamnosyltransferase